MKKCPTCEKTFEDSMKFCQVDGTQLVDDEPAFDPYATIVARPDIPEVKQEPEAPEAPEIPETEETSADEAAPSEAEPEPPTVEDKPEEQPIHLTIGSVPIAPPAEVLDLPDVDPLKTMYVPEAEIRGAFEPPAEEPKPEEPEAEEPVAETPLMPEPPAFIMPEASSVPESAPPPSPFSMGEGVHKSASPEPEAAEPERQEVEFDEAATMIQSTPFAAPEPPAPVEAWTPPPAPDANWQDQQIGQNTPFQPPPAGAGGENKTLAIVSLVFGIISLCCYVSPLTGLVALITGFLAMKNVNNDPVQYGGKGLAIAGMVTGGLFFLIGIIYWVFLLFFGGLAMMMDAAR